MSSCFKRPTESKLEAFVNEMKETHGFMARHSMVDYTQWLLNKVTPGLTVVPPDLTVDGECYENFIYPYNYPICWFRVIPCVLLFDSYFRSLMIAKGKDHKDTDLGKIFDMTASFMQYSNYKKVTKPHSLWKYFILAYGDMKGTTTQGTTYHANVNMDQIFIYMMYIMRNDMEIKNIGPGFVRRTFLDFFYRKGVFKKLYPSIGYDIVQFIKPLRDREENKFNIIYSTPITHDSLDFVILDYGSFLQNHSTPSKLELYITHKEKQYALSSFIITDYKSVKTLKNLFVGHTFAVFTCQGRYYCMETRFQERSATNVAQTMGDINLIERMICGDKEKELNTIIAQMYNMKFNLDKGQRIGMYIPYELDFSSTEFELMKELANISTTTSKKLAILGYFTKSVTIVMGTPSTPPTPSTPSTPSRNQVVPLNASNKNASNKNASKNITLKLWSYFKEGNLNWVVRKVEKEKPSKILEARRNVVGFNVSYDYTIFDKHLNKTSLIDCVEYIQSYLSNEVTIIKIIKIIHNHQHKLLIRNPRHEKVFINVLKMLNIYDGTDTKQGGSAKKKTHVHYKGRAYKVYYAKKTSSERYIICKKTKIYLNEIRGAYRWVAS